MSSRTQHAHTPNRARMAAPRTPVAPAMRSDSEHPADCEQPLVYLVACTAYSSTSEDHLSFEAGDVIRYMPQHSSSQQQHVLDGLGMGQVGSAIGWFPLSLATLLNGASVDAPPAAQLSPPQSMWSTPDHSGTYSGQTSTWLPQGNRSTRAKWQLVLNDSESCLLAKCISNLVVFLIVLSTVSFVIESLPIFHIDGGPDLQV